MIARNGLRDDYPPNRTSPRPRRLATIATVALAEVAIIDNVIVVIRLPRIVVPIPAIASANEILATSSLTLTPIVS